MLISGSGVLRTGGIVLLSALSIYSARFSAVASARAGELSDLSVLFAKDGLIGLQRELQALAENPAHQLDSNRLERARLTLVGRPLNSQVYAGLGLAASNDANRHEKADLLMALADRIGRRESISQLWLIEKSAAAGDVPGTLRHYNRILSTKPELNATLFPVLAAAIDFPEVRQAIVPYLRDQRPWVRDFVTFAASNSKVDSIAELLGSSMSSIRGEGYIMAKSEVIYRLTEAGRADKALEFARNAYPDLDLAGFSSFSISPATADKRLGRFAWQLFENENVQSTLGNDGFVEVTMQPATQADILTRHILLTKSQQQPIKLLIEPKGGKENVVLDLSLSCVDKELPDESSKVYRVTAGGFLFDLSGSEDLRGCNLAFVSLKARTTDGQMPFVFRVQTQSAS